MELANLFGWLGWFFVILSVLVTASVVLNIFSGFRAIDAKFREISTSRTVRRWWHVGRIVHDSGIAALTAAPALLGWLCIIASTGGVRLSEASNLTIVPIIGIWLLAAGLVLMVGGRLLMAIRYQPAQPAIID